MANTPPTNSQSESPTPGQAARIPWSPLVAVLVTFGTFIGGAYIGKIIGDIYAGLVASPATSSMGWLYDRTFIQFISIALVEAVMAGIILWFVKYRKTSASSIGLVRPRLRDVGWASLSFPVYIGFYIVLVTVATALLPGLNTQQEQQIGFDTMQPPAGLLMVFTSLVILPPLVEELIMRGFLFTSLLKRYSFGIATVITSILFALPHLQLDSGAPPLWIAAIDTFALSTVLCYLRFRTGSLWASILLHMFKNGLAFMTIFVFHLN